MKCSNCVECNEPIAAETEPSECESCGGQLHASCGRNMRDPVDELHGTIQPELTPENPQRWCLACYETRAYIVRMAMCGQAWFKAAEMNTNKAETMEVAWKEWHDKYDALIDAWPNEPKEKK